MDTRSFDVVVDFLCFGAMHAQRAIDYFANAGHYIFISTTALYDRQTAGFPLSEASRTISEGWDYAIGKAQAESVFMEAHKRSGFPATILRAAHTYDTTIPDAVGEGDWTNPWRLLQGKPIVIHGDGTTVWTLTHSLDFANGVIEFLKAGKPPGGTFNVVADKVYTWREITMAICHAIGVEEPRVCYRTTEEIASVSPRLGKGLTGHKMWSDVYDSSRFKQACPEWRCLVSLEDGLRQAIQYFRSDGRLMVPDQALNGALDQLCSIRPATTLCEQSTIHVKTGVL